MTTTDIVFAGSIPALYETHLVPLIFEQYADDLVKRLASRRFERVLELAAGTGVVTRALASAFDAKTAIVATDLNQAMLSHARQVGTSRAVEWQEADAMSLPFPDASFDCIVCQFGVMFFPDKPRAFAEARRVLRPGGTFAFNVWDSLAENEFAHVVTTALASVFPNDPPRFFERAPHGYYDKSLIMRDLAAGGFTTPPVVDTVTRRSRAASATIPGLAYCQGTPLRNEIEARDPARLAEATEAVTKALAKRFGGGVVDGKIQAHVFVVPRD